MTRARIIDQHGNVEEVSGASFFERAFGHPPRTREQIQAEYDAKVEWYVERILDGCVFQTYGNPAVAEAMKRIALREGDAEVTGDPLLVKRRAA